MYIFTLNMWCKKKTDTGPYEKVQQGRPPKKMNIRMTQWPGNQKNKKK